MFKKLLLVGILVISMTAVLFSEASAITCYRCRSLCAEEIYKHLGNVQKYPTQSIIQLSAEEVTIPFWCNNGDQCHQGPGNPFVFSSTQTVLTDSQRIATITKNGRAIVDAYFPTCEMWDVVFCSTGGLQEVCIEYDTSGNCLDSVLVCTTSYNYSIIPETGYPSNGNTNWYPEPPNCNPAIYPLGNNTGVYNGDIIWNKIWATSATKVSDTEYLYDRKCLVLDADQTNYNEVPLTQCCHYTGTCGQQ